MSKYNLGNLANINQSFNYSKINKLSLKKNFISNISGMKFIIKGRLMKRKSASRSKKIVLTKGVFNFNSSASLIDYKYTDNLLSKGIGGSTVIKNGSISIKIFISNNIYIND
jgi:hypothetical protein